MVKMMYWSRIAQKLSLASLQRRAAKNESLAIECLARDDVRR